MGTSTYDMAEIGQARQAIGAEAGRFGSVGDAVPPGVAGGAFGTLPNAAGAARAVNALCGLLRTEYARAETLVGAIERTLDANVADTAGTERANRRSFTTRPA